MPLLISLFIYSYAAHHRGKKCLPPLFEQKFRRKNIRTNTYACMVKGTVEAA